MGLLWIGAKLHHRGASRTADWAWGISLRLIRCTALDGGVKGLTIGQSCQLILRVCQGQGILIHVLLEAREWGTMAGHFV